MCALVTGVQTCALPISLNLFPECPILVKKGQRKCVNIGGLLAENCLGASRFCASARSGTEVAPLAAPGVGALRPSIDGRVLARRGAEGRDAVSRDRKRHA